MTAVSFVPVMLSMPAETLVVGLFWLGERSCVSSLGGSATSNLKNDNVLCDKSLRKSLIGSPISHLPINVLRM